MKAVEGEWEEEPKAASWCGCWWNWCSNLLMRSKLSPLSGFVHMKGHLPRRGLCDSSLTVYKLVSRCVRECEEDGDTDLHHSHPTPWVSLLELEGTTWEGGPNSQKCWGVRNRFNTFINSTGGLKHRRLAGCPLHCAVTELSAGFLWTVCNYLISEFIECSTMSCQTPFFAEQRWF